LAPPPVASANHKCPPEGCQPRRSNGWHPFGVHFVSCPVPGGVAALDHRLMGAIPAGINLPVTGVAALDQRLMGAIPAGINLPVRDVASLGPPANSSDPYRDRLLAG